jgi:hypothetical protein
VQKKLNRCAAHENLLPAEKLAGAPDAIFLYSCIFLRMGSMPRHQKRDPSLSGSGLSGKQILRDE